LNRGADDMSDDGDLSRADYYRLIRSQIEHEDELVNLRVVWQLLVQSFFFSAYVTLLNATQQAKSVLFEHLQHLLTWLIPVAAFLAGLLTFISIFTALQTVRFLRERYEAYDRVDHSDTSAKLFPPIQGPPQLQRWAQISPVGLPMLFIVAWLIIIVRLFMS
jgi:hypothetical protein